MSYRSSTSEAALVGCLTFVFVLVFIGGFAALFAWLLQVVLAEFGVKVGFWPMFAAAYLVMWICNMLRGRNTSGGA